MANRSGVKSNIPKLSAELRRDVNLAVRDGANLVRDRAKTRAPDATPHGEGLVAAIHTKRQAQGRYAVVAGDDDVFWGHFQEYGTVNHGAQPFLIPAYEESKREIVQNVRQAGKKMR